MNALAHQTGERFGINLGLLRGPLSIKRGLVRGLSTRRLSKVLVFQERLDESLHVGIINNGVGVMDTRSFQNWPLGGGGRVGRQCIPLRVR